MRRPGDDLTIVGYSIMAMSALEAAERRRARRLDVIAIGSIADGSPSAFGPVYHASKASLHHFVTGAGPIIHAMNPRVRLRLYRPGVIKAAELDLSVHAAARVLVFPNVGSYFGGDLIAGILYAEMDKTEETAILVDVGTNAEVVLGNRNWMMACAGAAGPALEGGVTRMGTTA